MDIYAKVETECSCKGLGSNHFMNVIFTFGGKLQPIPLGYIFCTVDRETEDTAKQCLIKWQNAVTGEFITLYKGEGGEPPLSSRQGILSPLSGAVKRSDLVLR